MVDSRSEELCRIGDRLFSKLSGYFGLCQEIAENFYPVRADYSGFTDPYSNFATYVQDGYPVIWTEQLASAIPAMLRQGQWFTVGSGDASLDERPNVSRALKQATRLMRQQIYARGSNWDHATLEADRDWITAGQPVLSIQENRERTQFVFRAYHPKNVAWLADDLNRPIAYFIKLAMTARNIVKAKQWGRFNGTVSPEIEQAARLTPDQEFPLYQVLIPADELYAADHKRQRQVGGRYVSCYIDRSHKGYLHEGSMPVLNIVAPAYRRLSGMTRGFSPACWNALADARMLQAMALTIIEQAEKAVDPPMAMSHEAFTRDISLMSGGVTFADLGESGDIRKAMQVIETSNNFSIGLELKQDVRQAIAESLMINKLTMPSVREMREVEVMARLEEFRRAALPFFTPIEQEYHTQVLGLLFDMMQARGVFPPGMFPQELAEADEVKFTFVTPLNETDGRKQVEAFMTAIQLTASASEVDQTVSNLWNVRGELTRALTGAGIAPENIKTDDELAEADAKAQAEKDFSKAATLGQQGAGVIADLSNASLAAAQAQAVGA